MSDIPVRKVDPLADTHYDVDTREVPRLDCPPRQKLRIAVRPNFVPITVVVKDISAKGIGLLVEGHLPVGACLALPWLFGPPDRWRTLRVKVVRLSARRDGGWVAGCVFEQRLDQCDVEAFLEHQRVAITAELYEW
jgi:hypothetical protein